MNYSYLIATPTSDSYVRTTAAIADSTLEATSHGNWNYWNFLDQLIAGLEEEFSENLRYERMHYAILPTGVPTEYSDIPDYEYEQQRIRAFSKFVNLISRHGKAQTSSPLHLHVDFWSRNQATPPELPSVELFKSAQQTQERDATTRDEGSSGSPQMRPEVTTTQLKASLDKLAAAMRSVETGVPVKDRKRTFRTIRRCFVGSEAVDWLLKHAPSEFKLNTRQEAVQLGRLLLANNSFHHWQDKMDFHDGNYFYRFREDEQILSIYKVRRHAPQDRASLSRQSTVDAIASVPTDLVHIKPTVSVTEEPRPPSPSRKSDAALPESERSLGRKERSESFDTHSHAAQSPAIDGYRELKVRRVKLIMDVINPKRYEWIYLNYDGVFLSSSSYHIEFQWMVCTGCEVDRFVTMFLRKAKQCGLAMMQLQNDTSHPFNPPIFIPLHQSLQSIRQALLSRFQFLKRHRPLEWGSKEYVHVTGTATVRVVHGGFYWMMNYNHNTSASMIEGVLELLKEFREACSPTTTNELISKLAQPLPVIDALEEWEQDLKPQESEDVIEEGEAVYDIFSDSSDDEDLILDYDIVYNFILYYSTLSEAPSEYLFG